MIPNSYLSQYSNEDVDRLISSGSITSKFDNTGNLLIDYFTSSMADTSITIVVDAPIFDPIKVEQKYDTVIKEFPIQ
jgi:hypothetical protein